MAGKVFEIKSIDGEVMHSGRAESRRALIAHLVSQGASFARADLADADLTQIDLRRACFAEARLDRADFRASRMQDADFGFASLKQAKLQGVQARRARFEAADLTEARLDGAHLTWASFRRAILDGAHLDDVAGANVTFAQARMRKTNLADARLRNADFAGAYLVEPDFSRADLRASVPLPVGSLPDRTFGTMAVGGRYADAELCPTVGAFRRDHRWTTLLKHSAWTVSAVALLAAMSHVPFMEELEHGAGHLSEGSVLGLAIGVAFLFKERVADAIKERLEHHLGHVQARARMFLDAAKRVGVAATEVLALALTRGAGHLTAALEATGRDADGRGFLSAVARIAAGSTEVVLCDRRHLALALSSIHANRARDYALSTDVVLVRPGGTDDDVPQVLRFDPTGAVVAVWRRTDGTRSVAGFDGHGRLFCRAGEIPAGCLHSFGRDFAVQAFERAILAEHDLRDLRFPSENVVRAGADGTLLVLNGTRRLDNDLGPAVLHPDGREETWINGRRRGPAAPPREAAAEPPAAEPAPAAPAFGM
ncbi:hypothetical protein BHAOGJBA_4224 [Methylobacterium hispanicum]|uniref:Pentapeptide repeat-containing protein n=1 Tax=Methylobacterium hispanicum TaxID=270350 RepID=A0AAV4ZQD9_9HYPH|nr:pentapeptide repeat-containing protein [Methylobacterium hispanicum]GJD90682.1 hypothetical protein BHAOGJBA_4224 [Methylobacterium hispanicum]